MMKLFRTLMAAAIALMAVVSCSHDGVSSDIETAEQAALQGDYAGAKKICDRLAKGKDRERMGVTDLCRMSMVYMQLSDVNDEGENIGMATGCMRDAMKINADSAKAFYAAVPVDQEKYVVLLAAIVHTMEHPGEITISETDYEADSTFMEVAGADGAHDEEAED